jgi:hypothetical protein
MGNTFRISVKETTMEQVLGTNARTRTLRRVAPILSLLFIAVCGASAFAQSRPVYFNETLANDEDVIALEMAYHVTIPNGDYWYDRYCGAWGIVGGPTEGFIRPGLDLGGPLKANASRGHTGTFVNGRELHTLDVAALRRFMPVYRGHFWVDADGNGGYEGGPAIFNIKQLAQQAQRRYPPDIDRRSGGRRSALSTWDITMRRW